jgi:CBS domain-containing protein
MICPNCCHDNVPGAEECSNCSTDLTQLDHPTASNKVEYSLMHDSVTVLHARTPMTLPPTATVGEAMRTMLEKDVGALLVVDGTGKLIGILSERDLLIKVAGIHDDYPQRPVSEFMTPHPETLTASKTLAFALHKMDVGGYRHMPLIHHDRPVGVISVRDIMRHITRLCRD